MTMNTTPVAVANPGGKAFTLDANGEPSWRPWAEVSSTAPEGFYTYQLGGTGSTVAALGPPPPAGVSSDLYAWRPGRPAVSPVVGVKRQSSHPRGSAGAPQSVDDPFGWNASIIRVCGTLRSPPPS